MKKLLSILLLFITFSGVAQITPHLGLKGQILYDTVKNLNILGTYLLAPNDSTINFDSSKVGISLSKNAAGDSIRLISGSGTTLSTIKDRGGVDSIWRTLGQDSIKFSIDGRLRSIKDSSGGGSSGWALTGNAGIDTLLNFVGTTDDRDLYFRRNNRMAGLIDSTSVNEGHTAFGLGALANVNMTFAAVVGQTAFGYKALNAYTGQNNTGQNSAFGVRALASLTTGLRNTAVGYNALLTTTIQTDNTAVGYNALLLASTSAISNTAVGSSALDAITSGPNNTGVGANAVGANSTGTGHTGVGSGAVAGATGDANTGVGVAAIGGAGASSNNSAVGYYAQSGITSGSGNSSIGRNSLGAVTTTSNNSALGYLSGTSATGSASIFLGYAAGRFATSQSNEAYINSISRVNYLGDTTESIFYSQQNATAASQRTKIGGGGTVGINKYALSTLDVNGSFSAGYVAKTGTYTATINDYTIECTANTFTVTLPTAVGITGRIYNISNSGAGTITIGTTSSQTFVNVVTTPTTLTLAAVGNVTVQSNGANWLQLH